MKKSKQNKKEPPSSDTSGLAKPLKKEEADGKTQDYGGIPRRDLKKNLGCG